MANPNESFNWTLSNLEMYPSKSHVYQILMSQKEIEFGILSIEH